MENKTTWAIDPSHSDVMFKVRHMMISTVSGHFEDFNATVNADSDDFSGAEVEFSAKIDSINTKNADRDAHLKSDEFFNAESFPELKFKSKSYDGNKLVGDLTIREVTKEVTFDTDFNGVATDPYGQTKAGFEISGKINRKDFNLTWSAVTEAGKIVVSDEVKLIVDAQFVKQ
jgi:polyisoprenoid-binding protein YceI